MDSKYAKAKLDYLDSLFHDFENQKLDDYVMSHIAKYLTVLCSGIYEDIVKDFLIEFTQKNTSNIQIKDFLFIQIKRGIRNPTFKNIKEFLNRFDKSWTRSLNKKISEIHKEALNSIVNNKNLIAHGESSTITFPDLRENYTKSKEIFIELDKIILS